MNKFFLLLGLIILLIPVNSSAQTIPPAPTTCSQSPCIQINWTQISSVLPGTATIAYCMGSASACGTPDAPGTNSWIKYSVPQTTTSGTGITPTLQYNGLYQLTVNYSPTQGGTSAWAAPISFQIGQAPAPPAPTGLTAKQL